LRRNTALHSSHSITYFIRYNHEHTVTGSSVRFLLQSYKYIGTDGLQITAARLPQNAPNRIWNSKKFPGVIPAGPRPGLGKRKGGNPSLECYILVVVVYNLAGASPPPPSAINVTLPALLLSAVLRRRCCWQPAPAVGRYLLSAERSAANPPHADLDRRDRLKYGRTKEVIYSVLEGA